MKTKKRTTVNRIDVNVRHTRYSSSILLSSFVCWSMASYSIAFAPVLRPVEYFQLSSDFDGKRSSGHSFSASFFGEVNRRRQRTICLLRASDPVAETADVASTPSFIDNIDAKNTKNDNDQSSPGSKELSYAAILKVIDESHYKDVTQSCPYLPAEITTSMTENGSLQTTETARYRSPTTPVLSASLRYRGKVIVGLGDWR